MKTIFSNFVSKGYKLSGIIIGLFVTAICHAQTPEWITDTINYAFGDKMYIKLPPDFKKQEKSVIDYRFVTYSWGNGVIEFSEGLASSNPVAPRGSEWNCLEPQNLNQEQFSPTVRWAQNDTLYMIEVRNHEPFNILGAVLVEYKDQLFQILNSIISVPAHYDFCTTVYPFSYLNSKINNLVDEEKTGVWITEENEYLKVECYSSGKLISVCMYSIWKDSIRQLSSMATYANDLPSTFTFWSTNGIPILRITDITRNTGNTRLFGKAQIYHPYSGEIDYCDIEIKNANLAKVEYIIR